MCMNEIKNGTAKIRLIQGDITKMTTEAIVNAANSSLMGGGGVDGAIHQVGGSKILEECKKIRAKEWPNGLPTGKAVITSGGNLKAKYVIHTVGPIWKGGDAKEAQLLAEAYTSSLTLAVLNRIKTIAFPSISTGAYGYPIKEASRIAIRSTRNFLLERDSLDEVMFVLFSKGDFGIYADSLNEIQKKA